MPKRNAKGRFVKSSRTRRAPTRKVAAPRRAPRRKTSMPTRRRSYARRARSAGRSAMSGAKGKLMKVAVGAAGGLAAKFGGNFNATWGPAAGMGAVGYFANNDTLLTLAGMSLSNIIPLPGGSGSSGSGGGWY